MSRKKPCSHNERRAMRVEHVLTWCKDGDSGREGLIDLLTDARHWCDRAGEDFAQLDRMAYQHYLAERGDKELCPLPEAALDAFWQVVASRFPEATSGDLSPLSTLRLSTAAENAVAEWVSANVPKEQQPSGLTASVDVHELLAARKQVAVIWSTEDVQGLRPDLTGDQAWAVLQQCERVHDCEVGFTWLLIETVADDLFPQPQSKE